MGKSYPTVSADYQKAVEKAKKKLRGFIAEKRCAPLMLRLAYVFFFHLTLDHCYLRLWVCWLSFWHVLVRFVCRWHSAGTYDVSSKTGGPFGTIKHPSELAHGANNGLDIAVRLLEPLKAEFPILSYADFYQVMIFYLFLFFFSFFLCMA